MPFVLLAGPSLLFPVVCLYAPPSQKYVPPVSGKCRCQVSFVNLSYPHALILADHCLALAGVIKCGGVCTPSGVLCVWLPTVFHRCLSGGVGVVSVASLASYGFVEVPEQLFELDGRCRLSLCPPLESHLEWAERLPRADPRAENLDESLFM